MNIKKLAQLAALGVLYLFFSRLLITLKPGLSFDHQFLKAHNFFSVIASFLVLYFYYRFYDQFDSGRFKKIISPSKSLKSAALFASIGALSIFLYHFLNMLILTKTIEVPLKLNKFFLFANWMNAVFTANLLFHFFLASRKAEFSILTVLSLITFAEIATMAMIHTFFLVVFFKNQELSSVWDFGTGFAWMTLIISGLASIFLAAFFAMFSKKLSND